MQHPSLVSNLQKAQETGVENVTLRWQGPHNFCTFGTNFGLGSVQRSFHIWCESNANFTLTYCQPPHASRFPFRSKGPAFVGPITALSVKARLHLLHPSFPTPTTSSCY